MAWMDILHCADGSYYVGSTKNLDRRLQQHQQGNGSKYTVNRRPVQLVYSEEFASIEEAYQREKQVKSWERAKREALINGEYRWLPTLSKNRQTPSQTLVEPVETKRNRGIA